jgi:hypothetical protein
MFTAIRWIGSCVPCGYVEPNLKSVTMEELVRFEKAPYREVSCELLDLDVGTFTFTKIVGLVVDQDLTTLSIAYYEDGWTTIQPDGTLRSNHFDESAIIGESIGYTWEDAKKVYHSVPTEEREGWSEGVIRNPVYSKIAIREDVDKDEVIHAITAIFAVFGKMPIVRIKSA